MGGRGVVDAGRRLTLADDALQAAAAALAHCLASHHCLARDAVAALAHCNCRPQCLALASLTLPVIVSAAIGPRLLLCMHVGCACLPGRLLARILPGRSPCSPWWPLPVAAPRHLLALAAQPWGSPASWPLGPAFPTLPHPGPTIPVPDCPSLPDVAVSDVRVGGACGGAAGPCACGRQRGSFPWAPCPAALARGRGRLGPRGRQGEGLGRP